MKTLTLVITLGMMISTVALKHTFRVVVKDPEKQYCLGPVEMNGKEYELWLSAHEVAE